MNIWDGLILLMVAAGVALALRHLHRNRQRGCSGCCASCGQLCPGKAENHQ